MTEVLETPVLFDPLTEVRAAGHQVGLTGAGCNPPDTCTTSAMRAAWSRGWACGVFEARKQRR